MAHSTGDSADLDAAEEFTHAGANMLFMSEQGEQEAALKVVQGFLRMQAIQSTIHAKISLNAGTSGVRLQRHFSISICEGIHHQLYICMHICRCEHCFDIFNQCHNISVIERDGTHQR